MEKVTWKLTLPYVKYIARKIKTITVYEHIYMEFKKMVMITLYAKQKKRHRCTEQTFGLCGRK